MALPNDLSKIANIANGVYNSITSNATAITAISVGGVSLNSTGVASNTYTIGTASYFVANGNLGIGTSSPNATLAVSGTANVSGNVAIGGIATITGNLIASSNGGISANNLLLQGDGTNAYIRPTNSGSVLYLGANNNNLVAITAAIKMGIGNTTPQYKLDVHETTTATTTDSVVTTRAANGAGIYRTIGSNATYAAYNALISTQSDGTQHWYIGGNGNASTLTIQTGTTERMRIDSSGNVGVGTSPTYKLDVIGSSSGIVSRGWSANSTQSAGMHFMAINNGGTGDTNLAGYTFHCSGQYATHMSLRSDGIIGVGGWSASAYRWYVNMATGDMTAAGNVTAYSDPRLKEDIKKIDDPLGKVLALNGVRFRWKQSSVIGHPGEHDYGVLANEVEAVMPELVRGSVFEAPEGDTYKTVSYDKLVPVLIEAIKEQQSQIESLRNELEMLKNK